MTGHVTSAVQKQRGLNTSILLVPSLKKKANNFVIFIIILKIYLVVFYVYIHVWLSALRG